MENLNIISIEDFKKRKKLFEIRETLPEEAQSLVEDPWSHAVLLKQEEYWCSQASAFVPTCVYYVNGSSSAKNAFDHYRMHLDTSKAKYGYAPGAGEIPYPSEIFEPGLLVISFETSLKTSYTNRDGHRCTPCTQGSVIHTFIPMKDVDVLKKC